MPTLAELLGLASFEGVRGRSFVGLMEGRREPAPRSLYIANRPPGTANRRSRWQLDALVEGDYKLIAVRSGFELYDLTADPQESRNVAAQRPEVAERLVATMSRIRRDNELRGRKNREAQDAGAVEQVRRETEKRLLAIGYIE